MNIVESISTQAPNGMTFYLLERRWLVFTPFPRLNVILRLIIRDHVDDSDISISNINVELSQFLHGIMHVKSEGQKSKLAILLIHASQSLLSLI